MWFISLQIWMLFDMLNKNVAKFYMEEVPEPWHEQCCQNLLWGSIRIMTLTIVVRFTETEQSLAAHRGRWREAHVFSRSWGGIIPQAKRGDLLAWWWRPWRPRWARLRGPECFTVSTGLCYLNTYFQVLTLIRDVCIIKQSYRKSSYEEKKCLQG